MTNPIAGPSIPPLTSKQAIKQLDELEKLGTDGAHKYIVIKNNKVEFTNQKSEKSNVETIVKFINDIQNIINPDGETETDLQEIKDKFKKIDLFLAKFNDNYVQRYNKILMKFLRWMSSDLDRQFTSKEQLILNTSSNLKTGIKSTEDRILAELPIFVEEQIELKNAFVTEHYWKPDHEEFENQLRGLRPGAWLIEKNERIGQVYFHYIDEDGLTKNLHIQSAEDFQFMVKFTRRPVLKKISDLFGKDYIENLKDAYNGKKLYQSMVKIPIDKWNAIEKFISTAVTKWTTRSVEAFVSPELFKRLFHEQTKFEVDDTLFNELYELYKQKATIVIREVQERRRMGDYSDLVDHYVQE